MNDDRDPGDEHQEPWRLPTTAAEWVALGLPQPETVWPIGGGASIGERVLSPRHTDDDIRRWFTGWNREFVSTTPDPSNHSIDRVLSPSS